MEYYCQNEQERRENRNRMRKIWLEKGLFIVPKDLLMIMYGKSREKVG